LKRKQKEDELKYKKMPEREIKKKLIILSQKQKKVRK
jgi:hypothetical protein